MSPSGPYAHAVLFEDAAGRLVIMADDIDEGYDVTAFVGQSVVVVDDIGREYQVDGRFEYDAVALLDDDIDDWVGGRSSRGDLHADHTTWTPITTYDGAQGTVTVLRDPARGDRIVAGHNGRHYIGYLEHEP